MALGTVIAAQEVRLVYLFGRIVHNALHQGRAGVREKQPRFGRRVVTNFTPLYIIISHYEHFKIKLYNVYNI